MKRTAWLLAPLLAGILPGCLDDRPDYDPGVSSDDFAKTVTNPFLPLKPGSKWVYESTADGETERIEIEVKRETKRIMGVDATVVRDTVSIEGEIVEDTNDWFAQDKQGNVWYLGEDTKEFEDGKVVSTEGLWEWGVDGALPGIIMKADPQPDGKAYFQEFYWGEAVDEAEVIALDRPATTEAGRFTDTVITREWTRLEPGLEEEATYARGVGVVLKEVTKGANAGQKESLTSYTIAP